MIKCFWLEPTDQIEMDLRRYKGSESGEKCPGPMSYHDASVIIGQDLKSNHTDVHGDSWDHADPRWPKKCSCGYEFVDADHWQFNPTSLYKRADTGELVTMHNAPVGAMMHADWLHREGWRGYKLGADGVMLQVKTPDGWWCVDGPTYGPEGRKDGSWTRTGTIPNVTASPSILMPNYHGWLRDGYLVEC